jgi:GDPmannose 4,6-dehydratase
MDRIALITGINGQAGSYLSKELLDQGYKVIGIARRSSSPKYDRLERMGVLGRVQIEEGDITDPFSITHFLSKYKPTHVFNTAAQSHVHTSFSQPKLTFDVTGTGVLNMLEGIRTIVPAAKFLQFSSSEMFGDQKTSNKECTFKFDDNNIWNGYQIEDLIHSDGIKMEWNFKPEPEVWYQDENTRMNPQSPYAIAKLAGYNLTRLYRKSYGLFASNVIMFNYESTLRGENFVTKKITNYINRHKDKILNGHSISDLCIPKLKLGNISAQRDWGFCGDYMRGCRNILEHDNADDFVLATEETHSVEKFLDTAFSLITQKWQDWVEIDPDLIRPSEVPYLCGKADKAKRILGWEPKVSFTELVQKMVDDVV